MIKALLKTGAVLFAAKTLFSSDVVGKLFSGLMGKKEPERDTPVVQNLHAIEKKNTPETSFIESPLLENFKGQAVKFDEALATGTELPDEEEISVNLF